MGKEQVLGIVRHLFTFAGGWIVAQGWLDEATVMQVSGAIITIIGAVWSVFAPEKRIATP